MKLSDLSKATTERLGKVEKATSAEALTGTVDKFPDAADVQSKITFDRSSFALYGKSNILGTVSQSGGVPTGAIIERGSNANGAYVKFADGTLICTCVTSYALPSPVSGGDYFYPLGGDASARLPEPVPSIERRVSITGVVGSANNSNPSIYSSVFVWMDYNEKIKGTNRARNSGRSNESYSFPHTGVESENIMGSSSIEYVFIEYTIIGRWY